MACGRKMPSVVVVSGREPTRWLCVNFICMLMGEGDRGDFQLVRLVGQMSIKIN